MTFQAEPQTKQTLNPTSTGFKTACFIALLAIANSGSAAQPSASGQQMAGKSKHHPILKPYTAEYTASVEGLPFSGTGSRSLEKNADGTWTLSFSADTAFVGLNETSQFLSEGNQLIANQYTYKRTGLGKKPTEYASFNWQQNKIHWQQGDKEWAINLKPETLDKLSYQLQLRMDLAASNPPKLSYEVADDDEVYERQFIIEGEEVIKTGVGKLNTIKVKIKRDDNDRSTWLWFAKDYDYFLVKLLQEEKGTSYTIEIKNASIDGKPFKDSQTARLTNKP
ncbi:DUF3108 domain-containing protein [Endozoicomonas ascidiicola]|uniref:DUF3108 domain-containing protein n=1 Tax=Endozoicomonas ascidiicola TaxID=1698521 RepID=UPI000AEC76F2|nr:DUF3108 domain-containing protein [Endozoicomonas ascidiicola]